MTPSSLPVSRPRRRLLDGATILLLLAAVTAVGLAFAWPWLPRSGATAQPLQRYAPLHDGHALLLTRSDADGTLRSWTSQNATAILPARGLASELREAQRTAITEFYSAQDETGLLPARLAHVQILRLRQRELGVSGTLTETTSLYLREPRGEFLVGFYNPGDDSDIIFDPPVHTLPADLGPGRAWESAGRLSESVTYTFNGRVLEAGAFESRLGAFNDCLKVESRLVLARETTPLDELLQHAWFCAGVGGVEWVEFDQSGAPAIRSVVVATDRLADAAAFPPAATGQGRDDAAPADPATWEIVRFAGTGASDISSESTVQPVWVPTDPPMLLAAGYTGDLIAFDAADPTGAVLWRFHPGGTIYGSPAFDAARGRIYFGASDKRLYALDARGLFLWSFATGDNVAGRPLVAGDTVVFGSEDRKIYGLDAATGVLRWPPVVTGGPVVASPALAGDVVVAGSDDGGLYGIDPATGRRLWLHATEGAIEAPVVAMDGTVYVCSRDGTLSALDPADGTLLWTGDVGRVLRTAPAVARDRVFVVDEEGYLTAFDRRDGRRLRTTVESGYTGAPALVGDTLVVAGEGGMLYRLSLDLERQGEWRMGETSAAGSTPGFAFGPTAGGGSLWLADTTAVVRRLGSPITAGPAPLTPAWFQQGVAPPFDALNGHSLDHTAVDYSGQAVVVDSGGHVFLVDPTTGQAELRGTVGDGGDVFKADPVVAGDALLLAAGDTLHAMSLATGEALWEFRGDGTQNRPPTVAGETVLWLTQDQSKVIPSGTLHALDLATGAARWEQPLSGFAVIGGAVVHGETVFVSTQPAAFDLATGEPRWRAQPGGQAFGAPALSAGGETLYVGASSPDGASGTLLAIDTADGRERWRADLGPDLLNLFEPPWPSGQTVVVPMLSGAIIGLDATSGEERWRHAPAAPRRGAITVAEGRVWFLQENARLFALDAQSGAPVAHFGDLDYDLSALGLSLQRPALIGGTVIVPINLGLLGFEAPR